MRGSLMILSMLRLLAFTSLARVRARPGDLEAVRFLAPRSLWLLSSSLERLELAPL